MRPSNHLEEVHRLAEAARNRHDAEREYRAALRAGRKAGLSLAQLARAAGVTKQTVHYMLRKEAGRR